MKNAAVTNHLLNLNLSVAKFPKQKYFGDFNKSINRLEWLKHRYFYNTDFWFFHFFHLDDLLYTYIENNGGVYICENEVDNEYCMNENWLKSSNVKMKTTGNKNENWTIDQKIQKRVNQLFSCQEFQLRNIIIGFRTTSCSNESCEEEDCLWNFIVDTVCPSQDRRPSARNFQIRFFRIISFYLSYTNYKRT